MNDPVKAPPVFFVNRVYWPEEMATAQLLTDLAEALARRGFPVTVICRQPRIRRARKEWRNGVKILRVANLGGRGRGWAPRAVHFGSFFPGALWKLFLVTSQHDVIVALTDPPLLGVGAWLVALWNRARLFHWVQDIYPEVAMSVGGPALLRFLEPTRNRSWLAAEFCAVLGDDPAMSLQRAKIPTDKIVIMPNWAPAGLTDAGDASERENFRAAWGAADKLVVMYSGNLGRVHEMKALANVAAGLRGDDRIIFVVIGDGAQRATLEKRVIELRLGNLKFYPASPRARLGASLAAADLHLVTLRSGCEDYVFPSKIYGVAAAGRPVIFVGPRDSGIARLVEDHGFGCSFEATETGAMVAAIRGFAQKRASLRHFSVAATRFALKSPGPEAAAEAWHAMICGANDFYPLAPGKIRRVRHS